LHNYVGGQRHGISPQQTTKEKGCGRIIGPHTEYRSPIRPHPLPHPPRVLISLGHTHTHHTYTYLFSHTHNHTLLDTTRSYPRPHRCPTHTHIGVQPISIGSTDLYGTLRALPAGTLALGQFRVFTSQCTRPSDSLGCLPASALALRTV
jgi:hypothetical protein